MRYLPILIYFFILKCFWNLTCLYDACDYSLVTVHNVHGTFSVNVLSIDVVR